MILYVQPRSVKCIWDLWVEEEDETNFSAYANQAFLHKLPCGVNPLIHLASLGPQKVLDLCVRKELTRPGCEPLMVMMKHYATLQGH